MFDIYEAIGDATDEIVKESGLLSGFKKTKPFLKKTKPLDKNLMKGVVSRGLLMAGGITVGAFTEKILDFLDERKTKSKSPEYYKRMLEAHPELKKMRPKEVAKLWESLYYFAPTMAADPLSAGAFIKQTFHSGSMDPGSLGGLSTDAVSSLVNIENSLKNINKKPRRNLLGSDYPSKAMGILESAGKEQERMRREKKKSSQDKLLKAIWERVS